MDWVGELYRIIKLISYGGTSRKLTNQFISALDQTVTPSGNGSILSTTVTLTDDQIKALPDTPVDIVPSPGAGKWISIIQHILTTHFEGGAYEGIQDGDMIYGFTSTSIIEDSTQDLQLLTQFLGNTFGTSNLCILRPYVAGIYEPGPGTKLLMEGPGATSIYLNQPIQLFGLAAGSWSGGNASNTLTVKTIYTIEDA